MEYRSSEDEMEDSSIDDESEMLDNISNNEMEDNSIDENDVHSDSEMMEGSSSDNQMETDSSNNENERRDSSSNEESEMEDSSSSEYNRIDDMPVDSLRPHLRQLLLRAGKNQSSLAREIKVEQPAISRFLSGKIKNPRYLPELREWMKNQESCFDQNRFTSPAISIISIAPTKQRSPEILATSLKRGSNPHTLPKQNPVPVTSPKQGPANPLVLSKLPVKSQTQGPVNPQHPANLVATSKQGPANPLLLPKQNLVATSKQGSTNPLVLSKLPVKSPMQGPVNPVTSPKQGSTNPLVLSKLPVKSQTQGPANPLVLSKLPVKSPMQGPVNPVTSPKQGPGNPLLLPKQNLTVMSPMQGPVNSVTLLKQGATTQVMPKQGSSNLPKSPDPILDPSFTNLTAEMINSNISYSVEKVSEGQPSGLEEELQWSNDGKVTLLFRQTLYNLVGLFNRWHQQNPISYSGKLLRGAYGAGKSSTLYQIVHLCRNSGWIVLYVCESATKVFLDADEVAEDIVTHLLKHHGDKLKQLGLSDQIEDNKIDQFNTIFRKLRNQTTFPVLIAVDQWNALFQKEYSKDHPMSQFKNFKAASPKRGVFFCAFSSSFDPTPHLNDNDYYQYRETIPPYTEKEFYSRLSYFTDLKYIPTFNQSQMADLNRQTGRLPRLLLHLCLIQSKKNYGEGALLLTQLFNEGCEVYATRLQKLMERLSSDEKTELLKFFTAIYLNYTPEIGAVPQRLFDAGLYVADDAGQEARPVCTYVTKAILKQTATQADHILEFLASDKGFSWRALELFVTNALLTLNDIIVQYDDGKSYELRNPGKLRIVLDKEKYQERDVDIGPLLPGTLVVCYRGHAVVDLVAYTSHEELLFIQISEQSYNDHAKKSGYDHLFSKEVKFDGEQHETIYNYFVTRATKADGSLKAPQNAQLTAELQKKNALPWTHYIYVTPLPKEQAYNRTARDNVKIIHADFLSDFGPLARHFVQKTNF